ncbi:MAG: hypothetical protein ABJL67_22245 [Sulfitobacter sp.]
MDSIRTDTHSNSGLYGSYMCDARLSHTATAYAKARQCMRQRAVFPYGFFLRLSDRQSFWALWNASIKKHAATRRQAIPRQGVAQLGPKMQIVMSGAWDVQAMTRVWSTWFACWHGKLQEILSKRKPRVMDRLAPAIREVRI